MRLPRDPYHDGAGLHGLTTGAEWIRTFSSALDRQQFVVSSELGPIYRRTVIQSSCRPRQTDRVVWRRSGAPSLTTRITRRHTKVALSVVRARRGTESSNPFPSSGESANFWFLSGGAPSAALAAVARALFDRRARRHPVALGIKQHPERVETASTIRPPSRVGSEARASAIVRATDILLTLGA